ncbi:hypothetical protein Tco_0931319 [Tanacetum coccineum]
MEGSLYFPQRLLMNTFCSREIKAKLTLLILIPDDHVADFHYMDDARDIWNAVKARFGGNAESKKMRKSMLKQEFSEFRISEAEGLHKGYERMQKILSQLNQLKAKPEDEDINLKFSNSLPSSWSSGALNSLKNQSQSAGPSHYAFVSTTSASKKMSYVILHLPTLLHQTVRLGLIDLLEYTSLSRKFGRNIDLIRRKSARFNKDIPLQDSGDVERRKNNPKQLSHSIEEGAVQDNNLIRELYKVVQYCRWNAGEIALMVVCHFLSDKSSEVNTNDFASSDSSVKSSEPKSNDSTSCASTSSVSTSESEAEIESNVRTPILEPIIVQDLSSFSFNSYDKNENTSRTSCNKNGYFNKITGHFRKNASSVSKLCFVCGSSTRLIKDYDFYEKQMANKTVGNGVGLVHSRNNINHQNPFVLQAVLLRTGKVNIPPARPQPVPTGKPKVPAPFLRNAKYECYQFLLIEDNSPSVTSGWVIISPMLSHKELASPEANELQICVEISCVQVMTQAIGCAVLRYVVPAGRVIVVPTGRYVVPAGRVVVLVVSYCSIVFLLEMSTSVTYESFRHTEMAE